MSVAVVDHRTDPPSAGDEIVPGYEVVALLRGGRRLDTYDVYSVERDCRCVVKTVRPDRMHEPEPVRALMREGELLRELTHPHLVRCYEVVRDPVAAIVLETLPGDMLSAIIEDGRLSVADTAELGLQLVSALGYLHRHEWLHLDVKPSNIAVAAGRATLIDLSLASPPGRGRPGAGTRGYLAPEQAKGGPLSPATDVFGLGVVLGECLTGTLAYGNEATWDRPQAAMGGARRRVAQAFCAARRSAVATARRPREGVHCRRSGGPPVARRRPRCTHGADDMITRRRPRRRRPSRLP